MEDDKNNDRIFLKKVNGKEEKMYMNVLFMKICERIELGINLYLIHGTQGGINMCGEIIN